MIPIRVKLLLLLLAIALPPLAMVTWLDQGATRQMGLELAERARSVLEQRANESLVAAVRDSAAALAAERGRLELLAQLQAREAERILATPLPRLRSAAETSGFRLIPHSGKAVSPSVRARLAALEPVLARLRRESGGIDASSRIALVGDNVEAVYPTEAEPGEEDGEDVASLRWVQAVRRLGRWTWLPLVRDEEEGTALFRLAAPITRSDGGFAGAIAVDVTVDAVLAAAERQLPQSGHALIIAAKGNRMRLLAAHLDGNGVEAGIAFESGSAEGRQAMIADMAEGRSGFRHMDFRGEDSLWAWSAFSDGASALLFVMPFQAAVSEAGRAESYVVNRVHHQRVLSWAFLVAFVPLVVVLALIASRHVTRPVRELAEAARRLSEGDFDASAQIHSGDELEALAKVFNGMVPQLGERMRLRESLALAQEVQRNLLPSQAPCIPGFDVAGRSVYCDETGGDYYDFFVPQGGGPSHLAVAVGDVSGHGVAAALLMTAARALLRSRRAEAGKLAPLLRAVNADLADHVHAGRFMTLFLAVLVPERRSIHWVSAGHDPALAYDPETDRFEEIAGADIPLGIEPDWRFHERSHSGWVAGALMVVGTDGIWESRDPGGAQYGKDRLRQVVRQAREDSAEGIVNAIMADLDRFRRGRPQTDDATVVVVKAV